MLKGIYTIIIKLQKGRDISIGKLETISVAAGYYVYVGSALNGLSSRIVRHLRKEKKLHWHIDYFLQKTQVIEIIYCVTEENRECVLSSRLDQKLKHVRHFGCSDCSCQSHLFRSKNLNALRTAVRRSFKESNLEPFVW